MKHAALLLSLTAVLHAACNIPDPGNIHAAECADACETANEPCTETHDKELRACTTLECADAAFIAIEACWKELVHCENQCLHEAEEVLK